VGVLAGPHALHLVDPQAVSELAPVNTLALLASIALAGGAELRVPRLLPLRKSLAWTTLMQSLIGACGAHRRVSGPVSAARFLFSVQAHRVGSALAGDEPVERRWGWSALISQAGLTLGMSALIERAYPRFGSGFRSLAVATWRQRVAPAGVVQAGAESDGRDRSRSAQLHSAAVSCWRRRA